MAPVYSKHGYSHLYYKDEKGKDERVRKNELRYQIVIFLASRHTDSHLHTGAIKSAKELLPYSYTGIQKVWYCNKAHVPKPNDNPLCIIGQP